MSKNILLGIFVLGLFYFFGKIHKNSLSHFQSDAVAEAGHREDARILKEESGTQLFKQLLKPVDTNSLSGVSVTTLQAVQERFAQPYSRQFLGHVSMADKEAVQRIGILKALGNRSVYLQDADLKKQVVSFYEKIIATSKEHIMVKRQALRSLSQLQKNLPEAAYLQRMAILDPHVLALAGMSDRELIEAVIEK